MFEMEEKFLFFERRLLGSLEVFRGAGVGLGGRWDFDIRRVIVLGYFISMGLVVWGVIEIFWFSSC